MLVAIKQPLLHDSNDHPTLWSDPGLSTCNGHEIQWSKNGKHEAVLYICIYIYVIYMYMVNIYYIYIYMCVIVIYIHIHTYGLEHC